MSLRTGFDDYLEHVRAELHASFVEEYSPHQIAGSFSLGAFITMLPTWGIGVLAFFVLAFLFDWINRIALFSSVIVFNPVVKWGVYASSLAVGLVLLGPIDEHAGGAARAILIRLLVGNLLLAIVATIASYGIVYWLVTRYRSRADDLVETVIEEIDQTRI